MEEIKDLIKQEDYEKYKKLLQEFECKAIDIIEDLTYQFKETLAEEIDDKIKGWKKDNERILRENWGKDDKIKQLEQQLAEKQKTIDEINKEFVQSVKDWKTLCAEKDKEIDKQRQIINTIQQNIRQYNKEDYEDKQELYNDIEMLKQNQTQLAINELEKVKMMTEWKFSSIVDVVEYIDNQIKELKGE